MATNNLPDLSALPETITKEQMYKICRISKRKAAWLLQTGLIPCYNTGKKTRNYRINTADVLRYLQEREILPEKYYFHDATRTNAEPPLERLYSEKTLVHLQEFYHLKLSAWNGVLYVPDVMEITGYSKTSVTRWINQKKLHAFVIGSRYHIPKESLIHFMCGIHYRSITRKSPMHKKLIAEFGNWNAKNEKSK